MGGSSPHLRDWDIQLPTYLPSQENFYISVTGVVTFRNASNIREAVKIIPTDRLMVETDCPFMTPEPLRGRKTNEPAFMVHTAQKIAEIKEMDLELLAAELTKISKDFFGLPL